MLIEGQSKTANAAGFLIHSELHKARPDVHAVCHAHTNAGRAWSSFATGLDMLNQDICYLYDSIAVYSSYGGIVFAEEEGKNIARAIGPKNKVSFQLMDKHRSKFDTYRLQSFSTTVSSLLVAPSTRLGSCLDF